MAGRRLRESENKALRKAFGFKGRSELTLKNCAVRRFIIRTLSSDIIRIIK
jgi:hypothetical protein